MDQFKNTEDKFNSLFTIITHNIQVNEIITKLYHRLGILKNISDSYKRKYLNNRVYSLINYLKGRKPEEISNNVFLISKTINIIPITKKQQALLQEYNVNPFIIKNGPKFEIDYINALLNDTIFKHAIHIQNKKLTHIKLNNTKRKIIYTKESSKLDIEGYITENIHEKCVIFGSFGSHAQQLKKMDHYLIGKQLNDDDILEIYGREAILENHKALEECFSHMTNEKMMDRIVTGKDILKAIKNYMIQKLFCTTETLQKVKTAFDEKYLNFEIIEIKSLKKSDIGYILYRDYKGMIGLTYY